MFVKRQRSLKIRGSYKLQGPLTGETSVDVYSRIRKEDELTVFDVYNYVVSKNACYLSDLHHVLFDPGSSVYPCVRQC